MGPKHADFKNLIIIDHPVIQDRLGKMRAENTETPLFRRCLKEISSLMVFEATAHLPTKEVDVQTPVEKTKQQRLQTGDPVIVPILRAGLGMSVAVEDVLSEAAIGCIGVYRDEKTKLPHEYLVRLPEDLSGKQIIVVDPMLATGCSLSHTISVLIEHGAILENIVCMTLVSAPEGVRHMEKVFPSLKIFTAALDEKLNADAFIVPGLGDAGDRIFGT